MENGELQFTIRNRNNDPTYFECIAYIARKRNFCQCRMYINPDKNMWTISAWYTVEGYKNQGIGKKTLGEMLKHIYVLSGKPVSIKYIWDGSNEYVKEWMVKHFDAVCDCSIAVQKMQEAEDDWASHMYSLDVDKVLSYFDIF